MEPEGSSLSSQEPTNSHCTKSKLEIQWTYAYKDPTGLPWSCFW